MRWRSADAFAAEAHRVAEAVDAPAALAGGDDALGAGEAHGDRDFDQRVLAGDEARDRLFLVLVAGGCEDDGVDRRIGERLVQRQRPAPVAVARGEIGGGLGAAADQRVQHGAVAQQRLGMPDAHHAVADHADVHVRTLALAARWQHGTVVGAIRAARAPERPAPADPRQADVAAWRRQRGGKPLLH